MDSLRSRRLQRNRGRRQRLREALICIKTARGCALNQPAMFSCQLDLHHIDPNEKEFILGSIHCYGPEKIVAEIQKCCVLRSDIHSAVEAGLLILPPEVKPIRLTPQEVEKIFSAARPKRRFPTKLPERIRAYHREYYRKKLKEKEIPTNYTNDT